MPVCHDCACPSVGLLLGTKALVMMPSDADISSFFGAGPKDRAGLGIWGYLVHFKATGLLLLLVDCPTVHAVAAIARHPVFHYLKQQDSRYSLAAFVL